MMRTMASLLMAAIVTLPSISFAQDRKSALQFANNLPIEVTGDHLEVREEGRVSILTGNVTVSQGTNLMRSGKMTVHRAGGSKNPASGGDIERIVVEGGVYAKSEKQIATGDYGVYDMRTEVLELSGKEVVLTEGDNVIVGCKLIVKSRTGEASLESCKNGGATGRVKMLITPPAKSGQ